MSVNYQKKFAEICLMYEELQHAVASPINGIPNFFDMLKKVDLFVLRLSFEPDARMCLSPLRDDKPAAQPREFIFDVGNQVLEGLLDFNYERIYAIALYQDKGSFRLSTYSQIFLAALRVFVKPVSKYFDYTSSPITIMQNLDLDIRKRRFTEYHEGLFNLFLGEIQQISSNKKLMRHMNVPAGQAGKKYRGLKLYLEDLLQQHGPLLGMSFKLGLHTPQKNLLRYIEPVSYDYRPYKGFIKYKPIDFTMQTETIHNPSGVLTTKSQLHVSMPVDAAKVTMMPYESGWFIPFSNEYLRARQRYLMIIDNQHIHFHTQDKVRLEQTEALMHCFEKLKNNGRNHQLLSICKGYMAFLVPNHVEADQIRVIFFFAAKEIPDVTMHSHLLKKYWFDNITEQKGQMTEIALGAAPEILQQPYFMISSKSTKKKALLLDRIAKFYTHVDAYFRVSSLSSGNYFFRGEMSGSSTTQVQLNATKAYIPEEDLDEEDDKSPTRKVHSSKALSQKQRQIYAAAEENFPEALRKIKDKSKRRHRFDQG